MPLEDIEMTTERPQQQPRFVGRGCGAPKTHGKYATTQYQSRQDRKSKGITFTFQPLPLGNSNRFAPLTRDSDRFEELPPTPGPSTTSVQPPPSQSPGYVGYMSRSGKEFLPDYAREYQENLRQCAEGQPFGMGLPNPRTEWFTTCST